MLGRRTGRWLWEVDGTRTEVEKKTMLLVSNRVEGKKTSRSQEPGVFLAEPSHKVKSAQGDMEGSGEAKECRECYYTKEVDSGFYGISFSWVG